RAPGFPYPYEALEQLWKTVLLHQFHDILPGSSIAWVHREARETYARVRAELETLIDAAQRALAGEGAQEVVFNGAPHARNGVPGGGAALPVDAGEPVTARERDGGGWVLDNGLLRIEVDARGLVVSAADYLAALRDAVPPGQAANLLQLHPDFPTAWDAWDVDSYYRNNVTDLTETDEVTLSAGHPGEATVRVTRSFGNGSSVVQQLTLRAGERRLDIDTAVDWHESETFLKAAFPLDVKADRSAAETQFGHVYRPTHTNTSWEAAKFEICAHRWIHVAEPVWGVALVNDSTYGHDVTRDVRDDGGHTTTVRLSLLRAPRYPDPETDQGEHRLRYALAVGADEPAAVREGHWINLPERVVRGSGATVPPLVALDGDQVVVEALKLAEDRSGDVIVRLYEAHGGRGRATLAAGFPVRSVAETDLLERPMDSPLARLGDLTSEGTVSLTLRPFQIVTLRLTPA
ncbi:hypothetical protein N566_07430, partial [Streptomycetaceae bacterium MP113-05]